MSYKCDNCGNTKKFYSEVSVEAKIRINKEGEMWGNPYDIDKYNIDNAFEEVWCTVCGELVEEED